MEFHRWHGDEFAAKRTERIRVFLIVFGRRRNYVSAAVVVVEAAAPAVRRRAAAARRNVPVTTAVAEVNGPGTFHAHHVAARNESVRPRPVHANWTQFLSEQRQSAASE